jgi:hypothetical protein
MYSDVSMYVCIRGRWSSEISERPAANLEPHMYSAPLNVAFVDSLPSAA